MTYTQTQGTDGAGTKTAGLSELSAKAAAGTWHVDMFPYRDVESGEERPPQCEGICTHDEAGGLADSIATCSEPEARFVVALVNAYRSGKLVPAPAATPGVPDSVRALSEAVASAAAEQKRSGDLYNAAARRAERTFEDLTEVYETFECADNKLRQAKDALADHCLSLISAQPAGQAGDA